MKNQTRSGRLEVDLARIWEAYLKAKNLGDLPGQEHQFGKIKALARAPIFDEAALLFLAEGQADLKNGRWESARTEFLNAAALDPYLWPAYEGLAKIKRSKDGEWLSYVNLSFKGLFSAFSWNNTYFMFAAWNWLMKYLLWVIMCAFSLIVALLCLKYARVFYATHCQAWEEGGMQHTAARLLALVLIASPWALGFHPFLAAGAYLCLFYPFFEPAERKLGAICLAAWVLIPLLTLGTGYGRRMSTNPVIAGMLHQYVTTDLYSQEDLLRSLPVEGELLDRFKVRISKIQVARNEVNEAIETLGEIQPGSSYWSTAQINLGNLYLRMREFHRAMEYYQKVVDKQPDQALAHYHMWIVRSKLANTSEAEVSKTKAIELDSKLREQISLYEGAENATIIDAEVPATEKVFRESLRQGAGFKNFLHYSVWAPLLVVGLLAGLCWYHLHQRNPTLIAKDCKKCGMIYMPDDAPNSDWCSQCVSIFIKREDLPAESKQKKAEEIKRFNTKRKLVLGSLQLLFPGFKGLIHGKPYQAGVVLLCWTLLCVGVFYSVDQIEYPFMAFIDRPSVMTYATLITAVIYWLIFGLRPLFQED